MRMIELYNGEYSEGKHGFTMAMNAFGDMASEEFKQVMNGFQHQKHKNGKTYQESLLLQLPKSVDWREKGYVTPVKNQGQGSQGCNGGLMDFAFEYVKENKGLESEKSYPYEGKDGSCKYKPELSAANDTGFVDIPQQEKALMKAMVEEGPIAVAVDAGLMSFQFYKDGIYFDPECSSKDLNHGVLVVGYGYEEVDSEKNEYWLVKNSWGSEWDAESYIKIARNRNNHCGIATVASYPST
ncbi:Cathepsin L1 [Heterocephalus glaber]|uniref:Cathepsin L1 n=1 Tax=Heterocephalus glaber TaxID=10181 RepID=G5B5H8_HETGA|nr:Cathepsin L1 [Heterocephalus glaber]